MRDKMQVDRQNVNNLDTDVKQNDRDTDKENDQDTDIKGNDRDTDIKGNDRDTDNIKDNNCDTDMKENDRDADIKEDDNQDADMKEEDNQDADMKEEGELGSEDNAEAETPPANISYRKLNIPFKKTDNREKHHRKRWTVKNTVQKSTMNISSQSLKDLLPNFKLVYPKPKAPIPEEIPPPTEDKTDIPADKPKREVQEKPPAKKRSFSDNAIDAVEQMGSLSCAMFSSLLSASCKKKAPVKKSSDVTKKKEILVRKEKPPEKPDRLEEELPTTSKSSAKPASCIIFIQNLVRPFTVQQLKDMLAQTGTIVKDGFWIDKIKSKCFVKYDNVEDAAKTRELLDGSKWPLSNPKILNAEFSTQEEFDLHTKNYEYPKPPPAFATSHHESNKREDNFESSDVRKRLKKVDHHSRERNQERERSKNTFGHIREWDKDKISQDSPERENIRPSHKEVDRTSERKREKKESKKKPVEETPAKLLDDLFHKTQSTPCIYWLPLTDEQSQRKEEERKQRRLDRERRNQEEEAKRRARQKQREKANRSRSRSRTGRRR